MGRVATVTFRPRPHQALPQGDWTVGVCFGGRGVGKSWNLTRWLLTMALVHPGTTWGAVAQTWGDALGILAEGESGFKTLIEGSGLLWTLKGGTWESAFNRSSGRMQLTFANGSRIQFASADRPKSLRGKNWHGAVADEVAFWAKDSWDILRFAVRLRLPDDSPPRILCGTTPDGENWFAEEFLLCDLPKPGLVFAGGEQGGSLLPDPPPATFDNPHLDPTLVKNLVDIYGDTDVGRQELYGEVLSRTGSIYTLDALTHTRAGLEDPASPAHDPGWEWPAGPGDDGVDLVVCGQDYGTVHPSALVVLARKDGRWCAVAEVVQTAATEPDWHAAISGTLEQWTPDLIWSDSNFPQTLKSQQRRRLPVKAVDKGAGSVDDGIREVQRALNSGQLVIDREACPQLWSQLGRYRWKVGTDGQPSVPARPVKANDDAPDALRYALYGQATKARRRMRIAG